MHDEGGSDSYGRNQADDPWNDDQRKAYVKRMIKEAKDLPEQFRRPDYVSGPIALSVGEGGSTHAAEIPHSEEARVPPRPPEKKKEYEL